MTLVSIPSNPVPEDVVSGTIKTPDGAELRFARWAPPAGRKGTVCVFTGRTEQIEKYFETVRDLRERGFAVAMIDWRGQGHSSRRLRDPRKGYVRDFADFDADLQRFMRDIVMPDCLPPYIALGHSMGGNVLLRAAAMPGVWFERIVLSAPMVRLHSSQAKVSMRTARNAARVACSIGLGSTYVPGGSDDYGEHWPFEGNKVTGDRERYARSNAIIEAAPDLGLGSATYRWLWEAFKSMDRLWRADYAPSVQVPILFAIAGEDRVAQSRAIEDFALRLKLARHIVIPHARHEIMQERDELRQQFWAAFDAYVGVSGAV